VSYFHSVRLDAERCKGCTNCIKLCPTEAIRVRDGKAVIKEERCIDCGECIRVCPNNAKSAYSDGLHTLEKFAYRIALPAPSLYGQFRHDSTPRQLHAAFRLIGFDDVFAVGEAADYMTCAMHIFLNENPGTTWISSSCPAIVRLIQVKFPELLPHLMPLDTPMELAAQLAKQRAYDRWGPSAKVGAFFITPCPAKTTAVHQPEGNPSHVDGTISISEAYGALLKVLPSSDEVLPNSMSQFGCGWALPGGEITALGRGRSLSANGVREVSLLLEELELGHLEGIDFIEAQACPGGCLGGPLTVANYFVSRVRLERLLPHLPPRAAEDCAHVTRLISFTQPLRPRPILPLDNDVSVAIRMLEHLEELLLGLPQLDCGACGAPSCRALAEDIVRGLATESDCAIKLRERVKRLALEMVDLATKLPPAMGREG